MNEVTVNKTIREKTFVKYEVRITRIDAVPTTKKSWELQSAGGTYDYAPEYDSVEHQSTEVLKMDAREEIDIRRVVKALLWQDDAQ